MKKMLLNYIIVTIMILVTFFSNTIKSTAASFKYSDFDWEELLEQNKEYWVSGCDDGDDKCYDRIIKHQKQFYERLYKILAHYQDVENITIDDKIIIETAFYGLAPDDFKDPVDGENNPYNIDSESATSYIGSNATAENAKEYFKNETDSLKTLINNMVVYNEPCYGISNEMPTIVEGKATCSGEFVPSGNSCVVLIDKLKVSFFDGLFRGMDILGLFKSDNENKCAELASNYPRHELGSMSQKKELDEEAYWEFLVNSNYFDKKKHLQKYFEIILTKTKHSNMSELSDTEYKEYEKLIKQVRLSIVNNIKSVLEFYSPFASSVSMNSGSLSSYWWPIGSSETTESDGKIMATGEPESTIITSRYGFRIDPITQEQNAAHKGLDIGGVDNSTNIIAAKSGTVISIIDDAGGNCVVGDKSCGGGYGNFIILQHTDGNYTVYAHMAQGTLTVKNGDTVSQGEVIGKMGSTGKSTGSHLHFEVRVGGNDSDSTQDPLLFIDANNPRKTSIGGDFMDWIKALEGTKMKDGKYVVHDAEGKGKYRTFSYGIVAEFNSDVMLKYGLDPSTLVYGSLVDISVGDSILNDVLAQHMDSVKKTVSSAGISLSENQLEALVSLHFNSGNIKGFTDAYNKYGSSQSLCDNYWLGKASGGYSGLPKRRKAECELFVNGTYNMNPYG